MTQLEKYYLAGLLLPKLNKVEGHRKDPIKREQKRIQDQKMNLCFCLQLTGTLPYQDFR